MIDPSHPLFSQLLLKRFENRRLERNEIFKQAYDTPVSRSAKIVFRNKLVNENLDDAWYAARAYKAVDEHTALNVIPTEEEIGEYHNQLQLKQKMAINKVAKKQSSLYITEKSRQIEEKYNPQSQILTEEAKANDKSQNPT